MDPRGPGYEFWQPERLWPGETAFLLGGGPSLAAIDPERLRGRRVIAINAAARRFPFADILFFTDNSWYRKNLDLVAAWPGLVITMSRSAKEHDPAKLKRLEPSDAPGFAPGRMLHGRSSGHTAISLAIMLGAVRVVLLGYDMRLVEQDGRMRSHFHDEYGHENAKLYRGFLDGFAGWNDKAQAAGIAILNATPGSALTEFPPADLDAILAQDIMTS